MTGPVRIIVEDERGSLIFIDALKSTVIHSPEVGVTSIEAQLHPDDQHVWLDLKNIRNIRIEVP